jgi:hypothetical protein
MLKKYGAGLPLVVCALAPAQSTLSADHRIALCAGRGFDGIDKLANTQINLIKENRIANVGPAEQGHVPDHAEVEDLSRDTVLAGRIDARTTELERVQFFMKDGRVFKNEPNDGDLI